jgi:arginyl-tRNA synthetase
MPPCLILKSDGSTLYPTRDIAAAVYRKRTYDFDKCIYVTSAGQSLHFAQWFKVMELMGYDFADKLYHVPYGTVSIGGEKLATRTGNVILLRDLIASAVDKCRAIIEEKNPSLENKEETAQAVGIGAILFYYLYGNRVRDINFIMDDALDFNGNTGPFIQYTYARIRSILRKAQDAGISVPEVLDMPVELSTKEEEIIQHVAEFAQVVKTAGVDYSPSTIANYCYELVKEYNQFYHEFSILRETDEAKKVFRLVLSQNVAKVIRLGMGLLGIEMPERM